MVSSENDRKAAFDLQTPLSMEIASLAASINQHCEITSKGAGSLLICLLCNEDIRYIRSQ